MKRLLVFTILAVTIFAFSGVASAANMVSGMAKEDPTCIVKCAQTMEKGISLCIQQ